MMRLNEEWENIKQETKKTAYEALGVWENTERRKMKNVERRNLKKKDILHKLHSTANTKSKGK